MATTPTSPKVIFGGFVAGLVTLLLTTISTITPDTFHFLGPWALPIYGLAILASYAITAWWTADPLRLKPEDQLPTPEPTPPAGSVVVNAPATAAIPATESTISAPAIDGGFQSKIEAAISGATPAADPVPAAAPAPAAVPATPAQ